ncbi:right-handed parallel beta-helix repeat-containing protein, partial [Mesorhizobium sp.]|uniref:right-handed parallel beta-helix repeat-containing protein n=1 Tax=Mesorhizobium sp. TaxID=1871066 RepID=UPI000FEA7D21
GPSSPLPSLRPWPKNTAYEQTIDGVAVVTGERVLAIGQTNPVDNGIWKVSTGVWTRAKDFANNRDVKQGTLVFVTGGTANSGLWEVTTADPIVIGTTAISFARGLQPYDADLASWAATTRAAGFDTFTAAPSSANLRALLTDETGTGAAVFATSPTLVTPALGTPSSGVATNLTFTPAGTGAVSRTIPSKLGEFISVKDFGAKGDSSTDDTAAITAALAAAIALGACVYAPAGTYRVSSAITLASGAYIYGDGPTLTTFRTASATANVFTVNGIGSGLCNLRIDSSVTRSAGWFVDIAGTAANFRMINFTMATPFEAIRIADGSADILFANGRIDDTVAATGRSVRVGTGTGTGCVLVVFSNVNFIAPTGAKPLSHIAVFNCGDLSLIGCSLLYGGYNLEIAPGASQGVYSVKSTNCYFDQAGTTNIRIVPTGTGIVRRGVFVNNWISAAGTHNIDIEPASTATVDGLTFSCNEVFGGTYGYYMTGISTNLRNITVANDMIAGSSSIGIAMDTVGKVQITNNIIGDVSGYAAVPTGVSLFGTMTDLRVANNNLVGSTSKIAAGGATFAGASRIEANIGYNPVGLTAATTMGASPFTYTAGPSPETHYVRQSATNTATIAKGGQQVATLAGASTYYVIELAPNQSYVTTWSTTAPTYTKDVH